MKNKLLLFIIALILFTTCKKIVYYPDKNESAAVSAILSHRGGRTDTTRENTLKSCISILPLADGIEVDVQISKDRTIWLNHSVDVYNCGEKMGCFPEMRDTEIAKITTCDGKTPYYTKLSDVMSVMADNFALKTLCIDLKGWFPCSGNSLEIDGMMRLEALLIIEMARGFGLEKNLIFEIETATVLEYIKAKSNKAGTYINSYGDFERAMLICLKQGYSGISYKTEIGEPLSKEKINLLHRKGLKLIAWNIPNPAKIAEYQIMGVDFIQKDF